MNSVTALNTSIDAGFDETCSDHEYYFDDTNDQSWSCTFGTDEGVCIFVKFLFSLHLEVHFHRSLNFFLCVVINVRMEYGWFEMIHRGQSCR